MSLPRRTFVRLAATAGGVLGVAPVAAARALAAPRTAPRTPDVFVPTRRAPLPAGDKVPAASPRSRRARA